MTASFYPPTQAPPDCEHPHGLVFRPASDQMDYNVGDHVLNCEYTETRGHLSQGPEKEHRSGEITLQVVPGPPYALKPLEEDASFLSSMSASNHHWENALSERDQEDQRKSTVLAEGVIRFVVVDRKGNTCMSPSNESVKASIAPLDEEEAPGNSGNSMPRLANGDDKGCVAANWSATGRYIFHELRLEPGAGTQEGNYSHSSDRDASDHSQGNSSVQSWSTQFHFETDHARLDKIREITQKLQPLKKRKDNYDIEFQRAQGLLEQAQERVRAAAQELPSSLQDQLDIGEKDCLPTLQKVLAQCRAEKIDMDKTEVRPHVFPDHLRLSQQANAEIKPVGYTVTMGYVQDQELAELLSFKIGRRMWGLYVETTTQMEDASRHCRGGICEQTVKRFTVYNRQTRTYRERNMNEMEKGMLNMPNIDSTGFLGYLVNMIQLPPEKEFLRDTLFFPLLGNTILFDTLRNAHDYVKGCRQRNVSSLSILIKENAATIDRNGYTETPRATDGPRYHVVFGSMPPNMTAQYRALCHWITSLENLEGSLVNLIRAKETMEEVRSMEDPGLDQQIQELEHSGRGSIAGGGQPRARKTSSKGKGKGKGKRKSAPRGAE